MKEARLHVRIPEELKKQFDEKCKKNRSTPSVIIRELMKEYIKNGNEVFEIK